MSTDMALVVTVSTSSQAPTVCEIIEAHAHVFVTCRGAPSRQGPRGPSLSSMRHLIFRLTHARPLFTGHVQLHTMRREGTAGRLSGIS